MKKFFSLAALMVCSVLGTMPARAQVPALAEGTELLVRTPEQLMYVIREMSAEALTFNGTLAALVANTELPRVSDITTFEQYLNTTWPARTETAFVWQSPALNVQEAAQLLVHKQPLSELSAEQLQDFYLISYPALLLEGPFVAHPQQLAQALAYYRAILAETPIKATLPQALDNWARSMAAVTDLGLFGTSADVFLILGNAKKLFPPQVTPWTDLITVQALLQYKAYDAIEELAEFRLRQAHDGQFILHNYWRYIMDYMKNIGHPLSIHTNKIAGYFAQEPLSSDLQTLLATYNPYNLFYITPSETMFNNGLSLRQNITKKANYFKHMAAQQLADAAAGKSVQLLRDQATAYTAPERKSPAQQTAGVSRYTNREIFSTDPQLGHEQLVRRALRERAALRQKLTLKSTQLNVKPFSHNTARRAGLEQELADLHTQYAAADARLHQIHTEHANNTPVDQISYLAYGEPLALNPTRNVSFSSHVNMDNSGNLFGLLNFFSAPVRSQEEADLKQTLLDRAEQDFLQARQAAKTDSRAEQELRYQNAKNKLRYVHREIAAGTPYETIVAYAYPTRTAQTANSVFDVPPMPWRFEGSGPYASFEAPVTDKLEAEAKQALLDTTYQAEEKLYRDILTYQYEIKALQKDNRIFGRHARARQLETYQTKLAEAQEKLTQAQQQTARIIEQIKRGVAFEKISGSLH